MFKSFFDRFINQEQTINISMSVSEFEFKMRHQSYTIDKFRSKMDDLGTMKLSDRQLDITVENIKNYLEEISSCPASKLMEMEASMALKMRSCISLVHEISDHITLIPVNFTHILWYRLLLDSIKRMTVSTICYAIMNEESKRENIEKVKEFITSVLRAIHSVEDTIERHPNYTPELKAELAQQIEQLDNHLNNM